MASSTETRLVFIVLNYLINHMIANLKERRENCLKVIHSPGSYMLGTQTQQHNNADTGIRGISVFQERTLKAERAELTDWLKKTDSTNQRAAD